MDANEPADGTPAREVGRLLTLAWPVILGQIGLVGMGLVDLISVRALGPEATAAVGIGNTLSFAVLGLTIGAASGLDPLVSQAYGAGDPRAAGAAALRGAIVLAILCVPITLVLLGSEPVFVALGQAPEVIPLAAEYCRIQALSVVPFAGFSLVRQWLQGGGVMRPAMWVVLVANVLHALADVVLVLGWGPFPALGVPGVAWATALSRWFMFGALVALGRPALARSWPVAPILNLRAIAIVAGVAVPVALQIGLEMWAFNAMSFFAGQLGAPAAAAHTAALSAASLSFMLPLGLSAAAATRVGNLVGAGLEWRRPAVLSLGLGLLFMTLPASLFYFAPRWVGAVYNTDPSVIAIAATILPLAAAFQWFDGTQVVSFGVLRGLGDVRIPALFNVIAYYCIGIPIGWALAFHFGLGLVGLWYGLVAGLAVVASLLVIRIVIHVRRGG